MIERVVRATGEPETFVVELVRCLRDAVDELFRGGFSILAPPVLLAYKTDAIFDQVLHSLGEATDEQVGALYVGDGPGVAAWLGVPLEIYDRHPVASELLVLSLATEAAGLEGEAEADRAFDVMRAYLDTFAGGRRYRFSSIGLERDLQRWLVHHPERLEDLGYTVRRCCSEYRLADGRRADLVFDLVDPEAGPDSRLVVELKAGPGSRSAVDQLVGYVTDLDRRPGQAVHGLLVADGFSPGTLDYADAYGVATATISRLGYRAEVATRAVAADGVRHLTSTVGMVQPAS